MKYQMLLTAEEEAALGRRALAGDQIARNQLVMANIPLAKSISRKTLCRQHGRRCDDLEQVAFVALCKAAEKFDPDHGEGVRFSTYAYPAIERACWDGCEGARQRLKTVSLDQDPPAPEPAPPPDGELATAVAKLGGVDAFVLEERYPLDGTGKRSLRQIGAELGCSKQRVERIERRALGRLRERIASRKAAS